MGPPGPPGAQGPPGPQGPPGATGPAGSSTTPIAPLIWTATPGASGGPTYTFATGVNGATHFDTSAGTITATLDPTPSNGETIFVKDVGLALATHALTISTGGAKIEYPPGVIETTNLVFGGAFLGFGATWEWITTYMTWFLR